MVRSSAPAAAAMRAASSTPREMRAARRPGPAPACVGEADADREAADERRGPLEAAQVGRAVDAQGAVLEGRDDGGDHLGEVRAARPWPRGGPRGARSPAPARRARRGAAPASRARTMSRHGLEAIDGEAADAVDDAGASRRGGRRGRAPPRARPWSARRGRRAAPARPRRSRRGDAHARLAVWPRLAARVERHRRRRRGSPPARARRPTAPPPTTPTAGLRAARMAAALTPHLRSAPPRLPGARLAGRAACPAAR